MTCRDWYIDSTSGSSKITLQKKITDQEFLSLAIRADEKGDVQPFGKNASLISIHCIHNIDCTENFISKQLYYTVSF